MTPGFRRGLIWLGTVVAVSAPAPAAAQTWGELRLPGGVAAARRIVNTGTVAGRPDGLWLVDAIRRTQGVSGGRKDIDNFRDYLNYLEWLAAAATACPDGCRLVPRSASSAEKNQARQFANGLGFDRKDNDQRVELGTSIYDKQKHAWLATLGIDAAAIVETLNTHRPVDLRVENTVLPLPLPGFFRQKVFRSGRSEVLAILSERRTAWLYAALMSCSEGTLRMLAANPTLVDRLHQESGAAFVLAGRALRLGPDRVETPGDAGAAAIWEALTGRAVTDVYSFTQELLRRDAGRLAHFYAVAAQLDERRQGFVLGRHLPPGDRASFVQRLYQRFSALDSAWDLDSSPFLRPDFDPQLMFMFVDVTTDGTIGPAWWPSLFERAIDDAAWSGTPDRAPVAPDDRPADALWLISWVFERPADAGERFHMVRFAQRRFASQPRTAMPAIAMTLAAMHDMPTLPLALERMGVREPAIYQMLASAAHGFQGDGDRDLADLQRWQAALALFEQIQIRNPAAETERTSVLIALASAGQLPRDQRPGAVGAWLADVLLPAYASRDPDAGGQDLALMKAFFAPIEAAPQVQWEGFDYVLDPVSVQIPSAVAIQTAWPAPRLFDVAALHLVWRQLEAGVTSVEGRQAIVDRLVSLTDAVNALPENDGRPASAVEQFSNVVKHLQQLAAGPEDLTRAALGLDDLRQVIDAMTDAAMMSATYALASVPTSELPGILAGRWARHRITPADVTAPKTSIAWTLARPELVAQGGTVLRGSWLGLDLALAETRLRRVGDPPQPGFASMADPERASIFHRLVIETPGPRDPAGFEAVVNGVAAGRARLAAWAASLPDDLEMESALLRAGVRAEDANVMRWAARRADASAFSTVAPSALYRLGSGAPLPDGWGGVFVPADGCWCVIGERPGGTAAAGRRRGAGTTTALETDLAVRLAELIAAAHLPGALLSPVLPYAAQDWLDGVRQFAPEDTESIEIWPRLLDAARLERYLLMLIADGVLRPPKGSPVQ